MAQQTINIGSAPDDGTGDTIRVGGDKINDNFTELYAADAALGTAAALDIDTDDTLAADSDSLIPTQQAVKAYVDAVAGGIAQLDDVGDVNAPTPGNGEVLTWDSTPGEWVSQALPGAGSFVLDDATDVDTTGVADGDVLTYDSGGGEWVASAPTGGGSLGGCVLKLNADLTTQNYSAGAAITWNGADELDDNSFHDPASNNTRMTFVDAGVYLITAAVQISALAANDFVRINLRKNGVGPNLEGQYVEAVPAVTVDYSLATIKVMAASDYLELFVDTESDTSVTVLAAASRFCCYRLA